MKTSYGSASKGLFESLDFSLGVIGSHWVLKKKKITALSRYNSHTLKLTF